MRGETGAGEAYHGRNRRERGGMGQLYLQQYFLRAGIRKVELPCSVPA